MRNIPGQLLAALRALVVLTVLLGVLYPLAVTGIAQVAFSDNADGSLVEVDGKVVGSDLIGQSFSDADGNTLPQWFQPRASNAGDGYDPTSTAASNLGPEDVADTADDPATVDEDESDTSLLTLVCGRSKDVAEANGVDGARPFCGPDGVGTPQSQGSTRDPVVPPDAVTASGSGLDPHISPDYARLQAARVAEARGLPLERVRDLVEDHVQGRTLGFLGAPRVNVLELNLALARLA